MRTESNSRGDRLVAVLLLFMQIALFAILAMVVLLVVLRYVFHTTIIGGNEATAVAFVFATSVGAALALKQDEHISIRFFTDSVFASQRQTLAIVRWALLILINVILFVYALVWIQKTGHFMMPAMGLPQRVAQISVPVGCGLGAYYCFQRFLGALESRRRKER